MDYKVRDKVFYNFKEVTIMEITDGRVTTVADDYFNSSGYSLRCMPDIGYNGAISVQYLNEYEDLMKTCPHINFPDIHNHLVNLWVNACNDDFGNINEHIDILMDFVSKVKDIYTNTTVQGVKIFRQR